MRKLHAIHVPHYKNTADMPARRMDVPKLVSIPVNMNIGAPSVPVVKVMDKVKVGQLIAEPGGYVSAAVHSSVSGTVKKIRSEINSAGKYATLIDIETDGEQAVLEGITPPAAETFEDFIKAVRDSGLVGLGGAAFPASVKLNIKSLDQCEAVIINGAECEPYITSDTRTMIDRADEVWEGVMLLRKFMKAKVVIGIESNKPACIENFRKRAEGVDGVEVKVLAASYPQGAEKVLIYNVLGRMVPEGKLPLDVGAIVMNCTSVAVLAHYMKTGMPLVEKCVTVDGSAVASPCNLIVPIGTHIEDVFAACGGFREDPCKVLYGGPMMGLAVPDLNQPVLKNTNALLAFNAKDAKLPEPSNCIHCGTCVDACPLNLMPCMIEAAYKSKYAERLKELKVNLCMECGCCAFSCPASRPLVQTNKLAKVMLASYNGKLKAEAEAKAKKNQGGADK